MDHVCVIHDVWTAGFVVRLREQGVPGVELTAELTCLRASEIRTPCDGFEVLAGRGPDTNGGWIMR